MFQDKTLVCKDCGAEFVFTAGEQEFYAEKGFQNEPIRCKACRNARKSQRSGEREMYDAVCAACGALASAAGRFDGRMQTSKTWRRVSSGTIVCQSDRCMFVYGKG